MKIFVGRYFISFLSFLGTSLILTIVHLKIRLPMLLLERFFPGYEWIEILLLASWAAYLTARMQDPEKVARWRKISWLIFSFVFFSQLLQYNALNLENIKSRKPGITCTYCGECLTACHEKAIRYHFLGLNRDAARKLYLVLTISLHYGTGDDIALSFFIFLTIFFLIF